MPVAARACVDAGTSRTHRLQTGGRVGFFLYTDDFQRDYDAYRAQGIAFVRPPTQETFGMVSVFKDLYGILWDLVQPS